MALTVLSPFPAETAPAQLRAALDALRSVFRLSDTTAESGQYDELDRILQRTATAVSARVERYAPDAPTAVKSEAVVRAVAYLRDTQGAQREFQPDRNAKARNLNPTESTGFASTDWAPAPEMSAGWFRRSGAMSLLSAWRVHGVGLVKTPD